VSLHQANVIVRLTADCTLIDLVVIDQVIFCYCEDPDARVYVSNILNRTFPCGMDVEVFSSELLFEADRKATTEHDRGHVTPYLIRNDCADITQRNVECRKNWSAYRFTLNYLKDYEQISEILKSNLPVFPLAH
jgi:spore coat polysaccharide biosynthesis protein SpsF